MTVFLPYLMAILLSPCQDASKDAIATFREVFNKSGATVDEINLAVAKLGELRTEETMRILVALLTTARESTRIEAARALAKFVEVPETAVRMATTLEHPDNKKRTAVRIEIVRALSGLKDVAALPVLHRVIREKDLFVAREDVDLLPVYRHKSSIQALIDYLKLAEKAPQRVRMEVPVDALRQKSSDELNRYDLPQYNFSITISNDEFAHHRKDMLHEPILKALTKLTGKKFETWRGWSEWWKENAGRFEIP